MFDKDTLIVSYDQQRGEPKGPRSRKADPATLGLGDCIDCNICVQVCPTGIDIRKGLQYECITCASCIDACNDVMGKMGYDPGLIRYTTQNTLDGKPSRVFRPRTLIYSTILGILFIAFITAIALRSPLSLDVIRDRNALYRETASGEIEAVYTLKLLNKSNAAQSIALNVTGIDGIRLQTDANPVRLDAGEISSVVARVIVPRDAAAPGGHDILFTAGYAENSDVQSERDSRFIMPLER